MRRNGLHTLPVAGWAGLFVFLAMVSVALADPPDQAGQGAKIYAERCITCHGDVGQGLTAEWRATWAEGDRNCWIPACHGGNPPKPFGFTLPRTVPALAGPGTLTRFANAAQLHAYVAATMPMQEPGVLGDDEYWALTAYLLQINGVPAGGPPLDATSAPDVLVPRSGQPLPKPVRTPGTPRASMPAQDRSIMARASAPELLTSATPATKATTALQAQQVPAAAGEPQSAPPSGPAAQGNSPANQPTAVWPLLAILLALAITGVVAETSRRKDGGSS